MQSTPRQHTSSNKRGGTGAKAHAVVAHQLIHKQANKTPRQKAPKKTLRKPKYVLLPYAPRPWQTDVRPEGLHIVHNCISPDLCKRVWDFFFSDNGVHWVQRFKRFPKTAHYNSWHSGKWVGSIEQLAFKNTYPVIFELAQVASHYARHCFGDVMPQLMDFVVESVAVMLHRPGWGLGAHYDNAQREGTGLVLMVSITCGNDGVPRIFRFTDPIHGFEFDVETRNGQLVVFGGRAYDYWRHESVRNKKQTSTVISLTMRLAHVCGHNQTAATQEFKPGAPNAERVCHERVRASMQAARGEH